MDVEPMLTAHDRGVLSGTDPHPPRLRCERHRAVLLGLEEPDYPGGNHLEGDVTRAAARALLEQEVAPLGHWVLQAAREDGPGCRAQNSSHATHLQGVVQAGSIRPNEPCRCFQSLDLDGEQAA
eukprot:694778-Pleurochrysis_carterae.AAC.1